MKGQVTVPLAFILTFVVIVAAWNSFGLVIGKGEGIVKKVEIQSDIHVMGNALSAAKLYLETAFKYSVYQAYYDFGVSEKFWHQNSDKSPSKEDADKAIEAIIAKYMNQYTVEPYVFLSDYKVEMPDYSIKIEGGKIRLSSEIPLKIEKKRLKEKITLNKKASFELDHVYSKILESAKGFLKDSGEKGNRLKERLDAHIKNNWKAQKSLVLTGCDKRKEAESINSLQVFGEYKDWDQAKEKLISGLASEISSIESEMNKNPELKWKMSAKSHSSLDIAPKCSIEEENKCDSGGGYKYTQTCSYNYNYDSVINILMEDSSKQFPVKTQEGKIKFQGMMLSFDQAFKTNI